MLLVDNDSVWISEEASGTVSATGAETGAGAAGAAGLDSAGVAKSASVISDAPPSLGISSSDVFFSSVAAVYSLSTIIELLSSSDFSLTRALLSGRFRSPSSLSSGNSIC